MCEQAGLAKLGHVALDGTKIKANASKHKAMSYERMAKRAAELQAEVANWMSAAEAADTEEDKAFGRDKSGEALPIGWPTRRSAPRRSGRRRPHWRPWRKRRRRPRPKRRRRLRRNEMPKGARNRESPPPGARPKLTAAQKLELAKLVEAGPDRAVHGVVRWRRVDLRDELKRRFDVDLHERSVGRMLAQLGYRRLSVRPRHREADEDAQEAFKTYGPPRLQEGLSRLAADQSASTYPASEDSSRPRWRYARSGPHKNSRRRAPFFKPGFRNAVRLLGHLVVTLSQTSSID